MVDKEELIKVENHTMLRLHHMVLIREILQQQGLFKVKIQYNQKEIYFNRTKYKCGLNLNSIFRIKIEKMNLETIYNFCLIKDQNQGETQMKDIKD